MKNLSIEVSFGHSNGYSSFFVRMGTFYVNKSPFSLYDKSPFSLYNEELEHCGLVC